MKRTGTTFSHAPTRAAFSLVELLGVIAIIGILVGISATTLKGTGGQNITAAGNITVDLINEARQVAISKNTKTMVVVATSGTNAGRQLTFLTYSPETTVNNGWSQTGKWQQLPAPIRIEYNPNIAEPLFGELLFGDLPSGVTLRHPVGHSDSSPDGAPPYQAAVFLPDGRPQAVDTKSRLISLIDLTSNGANKFEIIIPSASGNPIVRRD